MSKLIALYSPAPQSGKSTVADFLVKDRGFKIIKFAQPLKDMLIMLLMHAGFSMPGARSVVEGDQKGVPLDGPFGGKTGRFLMQTLGTEWGRQLIHPDLWTAIMAIQVEQKHKAGIDLVCDDMRFPNEYEAMKRLGARMIRVVRPGIETGTGHVSEGQLNDHDFDLTLINGSDITTLLAKASEFI